MISICGGSGAGCQGAREQREGLVETSFRQQKPTKGNNSYPLIKNNTTAIKLNLLPKCRQAADSRCVPRMCATFSGFPSLMVCGVCARVTTPGRVPEKGGESHAGEKENGWRTEVGNSKVYAAIFVWQFSISISIPRRRFICIWCGRVAGWQGDQDVGYSLSFKHFKDAD